MARDHNRENVVIYIPASWPAMCSLIGGLTSLYTTENLKTHGSFLLWANKLVCLS